jgi:hypothetical protein
MMDAAVRAQGVDDLARVIVLFPAVRGHRATALAVGAGIHHDYTVTVGEQKFRVTQVAGAIVGNAVIEQEPIAVGIFRSDFPAAQNRAVSRGHFQVFFGGSSSLEHLGGLLATIRIVIAGMKDYRTELCADDRGRNRKQAQ